MKPQSGLLEGTLPRQEADGERYNHDICSPVRSHILLCAVISLQQRSILVDNTTEKRDERFFEPV